MADFYVKVDVIHIFSIYKLHVNTKTLFWLGFLKLLKYMTDDTCTLNMQKGVHGLFILPAVLKAIVDGCLLAKEN